MRLLIICGNYTPDLSPRAFRWSAIAEHWAAREHQIEVVCEWRPGRSRQEVLNGVHVYREGGKVSERLRHRLRVHELDETTMNNGLGNEPVLSVTSLARLIHDLTWKKIYWPDSTCLWYFAALRRVNSLLRTSHYDGLISVSHPFTSHLVASSSTRENSHLKWLVDMGDPFCFLEYPQLNNHTLYGPLNYQAERNIFSKASAITPTVRATLNEYAALFPESAAKMSVVPPLVHLHDKDLHAAPIFPDDGTIRFVFMGTLYERFREPKFLLSLFADLLGTNLSRKLELHFFGVWHGCRKHFEPYQSLLGKKLFLHGVVSHRVAAQVMAEAGILVNLGNDTPFQLPSKVVEYASTGKPILNIVKDKKDPSLEILNEFPAALSLFTDASFSAPEQFARLLRFIEQPPSVDMEIVRSRIGSFQIRAIAAAYETLLSEM